jgi:flagellar hook assembly protein FlgD
MARDGRVRVGVYDMQGRLVKRLLDEFRTAGSQTLAWDGTNEWNQRVACGVYFLRIQALEGTVTRRVAVVR